MLKLIRLALPLAISCCYPIADAEAALNKCTDGKQITYTTDPCEKSGLVSAGPIKDAVTVVPLLSKAQKESIERAGKGRGEGKDNSRLTADDSGAEVSRETTIKPVSPLAEKMLGR